MSPSVMLPCVHLWQTLEGLPMLSCEDVLTATKEAHLIWEILEQSLTAV